MSFTDAIRSGFSHCVGFAGAIVFIVFYVQDSHGDNQYGPSPEGVGASSPAPGV